jgi:hypothetical protein
MGHTALIAANVSSVRGQQKKYWLLKWEDLLTSGLYYKSFTIVIYNRNDSTIIIYNCNDSDQYYKTINYDLRVVIYYPSLS